METAGARRLWALITALPSDAAVWRDGRRWTHADEIAALTFERAEIWGSLAARPHYKHPDKLPQPLVFNHSERPDQEKPGRRVVRDPAAIKQFFGGG